MGRVGLGEHGLEIARALARGFAEQDECVSVHRILVDDLAQDRDLGRGVAAPDRDL